MSEQHSHVPASGGIDRRKVVRAGVWAVPAVTLATAAPAFAATSSATGILLFDTLNLFGSDYDGAGNPTKLESQIQVQNKYVAGGPTIASLTVFVTYPASRVSGAPATIVFGTGWS